MSLAAGLLIALLTVIGMEGVAYVAHRYLMHGRMWCWHASHHARRDGWFELNDMFAVVFALVSVVLIYLDGAAAWIGWGMVGYGVIYALFHDGLVHGRIPLPQKLKQLPYLRHLVRAHYLHHAAHTKDGAVSYGFMYAPPLPKLRAAFRAAATKRRAAGQNSGQG